MKRSGQLITLALSAMLVLGACTQIKLSNTKPNGTTSSKTGGGQDPALNPNSPPPINGDWKVTFVYADQAYESLITFAQQGRALTGSGQDSAGPFFIQAGVVDGTKVKFTKKYADADPSKQPVQYIGDLEWEDDADYRGWRMGGHYKTAAPDGSMVDDKWVAISAAAEQAMAAPPPQPEPAQQPQDQQSTQPSQDEQAESSSGNAPDLSGKYNAEYQFNFKKIHSTIWLEQDGGRLGGHGVDTNTNEKFVVTKGYYKYPRIQISCHYTKGQAAAATRDLIVKAQVSGGPSLKGETQFGGGWQARIVR
jgi:hypothetical protein